MKIGLQINTQFENLATLSAVGEDFRWYMKLNCSNCGEETPEFVYCSLSESSSLTGGRGNASLVLKCKLCKRENSIDILKDSIQPFTDDNVGNFKTIVSFDCRGVNPTEFSPRIGWEAVGKESNTVFSDVDLKDLEWYEYDEKAGESVSITEMKWQFVSIKH